LIWDFFLNEGLLFDVIGSILWGNIGLI
jgi:hypothetical protein